MAEKLTDSDLKGILQVFEDFAALSRKTMEVKKGLTSYEIELKNKILCIVTKQPDPIPYCNCKNPQFNHELKNPYCTMCYGVPHNWKP